MSGTPNCIDVSIKETVYTSKIADLYVILFFFLCFIISFIAVIVFAIYVVKQRKVEQQREVEIRRRTTMRLQAASRARSDSNFDDFDDDYHIVRRAGRMPPEVEKAQGRSQSCISFEIVDGLQQNQHALRRDQDVSVVEILGTLFTNAKHSMSPTVLNQCYNSLIRLFDMMSPFSQEAFTAMLDVMLTSLLQKRHVDEREKLKIMTKYEQMFFENIPDELTHVYASKMHYILASLKTELVGCLSFQSEEKEEKLKMITIDLAKFMNTFHKEMISASYNKDAIEVFVMNESGLVHCLVERWLSLEFVRYRLNVIHEKTHSVLKKNKQTPDVCSKILNKYIQDAYEVICSFCKSYERDFSDSIEHMKRENANNMMQNLMELDIERAQKRCHYINELSSFNKKALTSFFLWQNDVFISSQMTIIEIMTFMDNNNLKNFANFQKINEKKLMKSIKSCEENLFMSCQEDKILNEEDLIVLSKEMTTSLRDFRAANQAMKAELLNLYENNISRISKVLQIVYETFQLRYLQSMENLRNIGLETLRALSNLQEDDMNSLEHDFEIAFWSINFDSYYNVLGEMAGRVHNTIQNSLKTAMTKDLSYSLDDMAQMLKQNKSILDKASFFSKPNPDFYSVVEQDLFNAVDAMSSSLDEHIEEIANKLNAFVLRQCSSVIHRTNNARANAYFSNFMAAKENLKTCSVNSRGYTSNQGSSIVKNFSLKLEKIWQSQFDFKSLKMKENFKATMSEYAYKPIIYFENEKKHARPMDSSFESFEDIFEHEYSVFFTFEKHDKSNAVKRVLDSNLENELMIKKFSEKIDALSSAFCAESGSRTPENDGQMKGRRKARKPRNAIQEQLSVDKKSKINRLMSSQNKNSSRKNFVET
eukprot:gene15207-16778_t